ncbi:hypothetical protein GCM10009754_28650 [Amycolatopsis minnesotensis]|uniref:Uncharacterized protein n=1 Tax=Amycolatopsis minnesotensis TaxID=337894 RepID=A0ABN2QR49_9PSEU
MPPPARTAARNLALGLTGQTGPARTRAAGVGFSEWRAATTVLCPRPGIVRQPRQAEIRLLVPSHALIFPWDE